MTARLQWSSLLTKGADIAREGLQAVERRLQNHLQQQQPQRESIPADRVPLTYTYQPACHCLRCFGKPSDYDELNVCFVPLSTVTAGQLRKYLLSLPQFQSSTSYFHIRFKIPSPPSCQDIFPSYLWADLPDSAVPPVWPENNSVCARIVQISSGGATPVVRQAVENTTGLTGFTGSTVVVETGAKLDLTTDEATKILNVSEKVKEAKEMHIARRKQAEKEQEDMQGVSEETKSALDKWAYTQNGTYKDLRTLLGTMETVSLTQAN